MKDRCLNKSRHTLPYAATLEENYGRKGGPALQHKHQHEGTPLLTSEEYQMWPGGVDESRVLDGEWGGWMQMDEVESRFGTLLEVQ